MHFRALVADRREDQAEASVQTVEEARLPEGDLLLKVAYSSINYKDALAMEPDGRIVSRYPHIPGIDAAGEIVKSSDKRLKPGTKAIVTGYGFGVSQHGGYSEFARVPGDWAVPLPKGLTEREAMALGTAGLTAAMSVQRLQDSGVSPSSGPVVVTGASGGVGTLAVSMLARLGYEVEAVSGKEEAHERLRELGAARILPREELQPQEARPLDKQRWAGAVDCVGGTMLASLLSRMKYGGAVTACGLTGGGELPTSVYPFILRGVSLHGIDSVWAPRELRKRLWKRMAGDLKPRRLEELIAEVELTEVPAAAKELLRGASTGRKVVVVGADARLSDR
ncbi:oxidoreductase [Paenibacillus pasadenensis]|uniref:oxidoreductase n=1 Tax=Paenibacillus pasadenensis TaxID=217090 RepID=UPI0004207837|nr:oxidoreductase [Paenibacillus pasadenensis]